MKKFLSLALIAAAVFGPALDADAGILRRGGLFRLRERHTIIQRSTLRAGGCASCAMAEDGVLPSVASFGEAADALAEVNALRAAAGLPAFVRCDGLTKAAQAAANYRAGLLLAGHTSNDFAFLPPGYDASAAGCAAWAPELGWGSCLTHSGHQRAGAAFAVGRDGRRYMHLFCK